MANGCLPDPHPGAAHHPQLGRQIAAMIILHASRVLDLGDMPAVAAGQVADVGLAPEGLVAWCRRRAISLTYSPGAAASARPAPAAGGWRSSAQASCCSTGVAKGGTAHGQTLRGTWCVADLTAAASGFRPCLGSVATRRPTTIRRRRDHDSHGRRCRNRRMTTWCRCQCGRSCEGEQPRAFGGR